MLLANSGLEALYSHIVCAVEDDGVLHDPIASLIVYNEMKEHFMYLLENSKKRNQLFEWSKYGGPVLVKYPTSLDELQKVLGMLLQIRYYTGEEGEATIALPVLDKFIDKKTVLKLYNEWLTESHTQFTMVV